MNTRVAFGVVLLWVVMGCGEPEPELAVAEASYRDDVAPALDPQAPVAPVQTRSADELRRDALVSGITLENVDARAAELEKRLTEEVRALQTRLTPVDVEMDP